MDIKYAKIIMAGLDAAGKTSILLVMAGEYDESKIHPTLGADRKEIKIFGIPIIQWDLGGQEIYRRTYLQEDSKLLNELDLLIYVIDVLDKQRHQETLKYYTDILKKFKETNQNPPIIIMLHKADPEILDTSEVQDSITHLKKLFQKSSQDFPLKFLITSIFNKESLTLAGGRMILSHLNTILKQYKP